MWTLIIVALLLSATARRIAGEIVGGFLRFIFWAVIVLALLGFIVGPQY